MSEHFLKSFCQNPRVTESWHNLTFRPIRNEKEDRRLARLGIQIDPGKYKIDPKMFSTPNVSSTNKMFYIVNYPLLRDNSRLFIWVKSDIL